MNCVIPFTWVESDMPQVRVNLKVGRHFFEPIVIMASLEKQF